MTTTTSYDSMPYISHPFMQTHPDRLAAVATLLGLHRRPSHNVVFWNSVAPVAATSFPWPKPYQRAPSGRRE